MGSIFTKADPAAALQKARAAHAAIVVERAELERQRAAKLVEADENVIDEIDSRIERLARVAKARLDAVHALAGAAQRHADEQREQQRAAAIHVIGRKLAERKTAAIELEAAIHRVAELFAVVTADRGLRTDWLPFPAPAFITWDDDESAARTAVCMLHRLTCPGEERRIGLFSQDHWLIINRTPDLDGVAAKVANHSERLLATLREMPLPDPTAENEEAP